MSASLLLDTHAYVWAVTAPQRLSERARALLSEPGATLLVSAATVWEMAIKHRSGRWPEVDVLLRQHDDVCHRLGAVNLPITAADAVRAGGLAWDHTDPFDRMLAAQAFLSHAALVTRDPAFAEVGGLPTVW